MSDANNLPETLDTVLRKYGKIWIWSILSTAIAAYSVRTASTLTISAFNYYQAAGRAAFPSALLLMILPVLPTVAGVWYLYLFLRDHIVPVLFPPVDPPTDAELEQRLDGGMLLRRAFGAVLAAVALELGVALVAVGYQVAV